MAHSCSPKQPNRAGRPAVRTSRLADEAQRVAARRGEGLDVHADDVAPDRVEPPLRVRRVSSLREARPGPGVPTTRLRGLEGVVREEEVLDRVRPVVTTTGQVRRRRGVDPRLVRRRPLSPLRLTQDLHPTRVGDSRRRTSPRRAAATAGWPHGT